MSSLFTKKSLPALYSTGNLGIPTDDEQATGLEKKELDALVGGADDPFNMKVQTISRGTKDKPQLVSSMYSERIVGCICDEDATFISWMTLKKGPPQRCGCGVWYKLTEGSSVKFDM